MCNMPYKIMGITPGSYSEVPKNLFRNLSERHDIVEIFDSSLNRPDRSYSHLKSYIQTAAILGNFPSFPAQWRQLSDKNTWRWLKATRNCEKKIMTLKNNLDFILQVGSKHGVCRKKPLVPYVVYTDGTMEMEVVDERYPLSHLYASEAEKKIRKKLELELYQNANAVLTFSEFVRQSVIMDYGIEENKVSVVYAGNNFNEVTYSEEKDYDNKTILFIGRDFYRKGGLTLIKAFKNVKRKIKDAKLIIVGSDSRLQTPNRIKTLHDFLGLKSNDSEEKSEEGIIFKGNLPHNELADIFKEASIFVMPSIQENFGLVYLEAMSHKIPCIGSNVDATPEIIEDGSTGYLIEPNNHEELAEKIIMLMEDENLMKEMGIKGRKRVEKYFTWDLVVDRMTEVFKKVI
jgi:glycosyltransferase involved in cell wall biosynthesis